MEMEKMFEKASRLKLRFPYKGSASVEDLWDLSLKELDGIYKNLNGQSKVAKEESLLDEKTAEDTILELKITIIKYIVNTKKVEAEKRKNMAKIKEEEQKIMEIIKEKKDNDLKGKSVEELEAMLAKMKEEKNL